MAKRATTTRTPKAAPKRATSKTPASKAARPRRRKAAPAAAPEVAVEAAPELPEAPLPVSTPEVEFALRTPPPEPAPPRPTQRRAVFFDVENTSRARDVVRMLEHLAIDRVGTRTEFVASGNWRVVGSETARLLAQHGAQLVHSAPATGVRDWSDLRIAVAAGVWLASARPGDQVDIVSDDRAFDAVGDVAASLGVSFRRLSYRKLAAGKQEAPAAAPAPARAAGRTRGGRGGRGRGAPRAGKPAAPTPPPERAPAPEVVSAAAPAPVAEKAQAAPQDELLGLVKEMLVEAPSGVSMDAVANRLRTRGFQRPPGSPRLVTRLRAFSELDVSPRGHIRLAGEGPAAEEPAAASETPEATEPTPDAAKRRRRRGGRGRRRPAGGTGTPPATAE